MDISKPSDTKSYGSIKIYFGDINYNIILRYRLQIVFQIFKIFFFNNFGSLIFLFQSKFSVIFIL